MNVEFSLCQKALIPAELIGTRLLTVLKEHDTLYLLLSQASSFLSFRGFETASISTFQISTKTGKRIRNPTIIKTIAKPLQRILTHNSMYDATTNITEPTSIIASPSFRFRFPLSVFFSVSDIAYHPCPRSSTSISRFRTEDRS